MLAVVFPPPVHLLFTNRSGLLLSFVRVLPSFLPSLFLRAKAQPLVASRATVATSSRGANERLKRHQTDFPGREPQGVTAAAANGCFDFQGGEGGGGSVTSNRETSSSLRVVSRGLNEGTCERRDAHVGCPPTVSLQFGFGGTMDVL